MSQQFPYSLICTQLFNFSYEKLDRESHIVPCFSLPELRMTKVSPIEHTLPSAHKTSSNTNQPGKRTKQKPSTHRSVLGNADIRIVSSSHGYYQEKGDNIKWLTMLCDPGVDEEWVSWAFPIGFIKKTLTTKLHVTGGICWTSYESFLCQITPKFYMT